MFRPAPDTRRSHYLKIRDRESYQFALAAAAVALDLEGDRVRDVRLALGGVATVPWRAREAEDILRGKTLDEESARKAADAAFGQARGRATQRLQGRARQRDGRARFAGNQDDAGLT